MPSAKVLADRIRLTFDVDDSPAAEDWWLPYELPLMPPEVFSRYFPAYLLWSLQDPDFGHDNWAWLLFSMADYQLDQTLAYRKFAGFTKEQFRVLLRYLDHVQATAAHIEYQEAAEVAKDGERFVRSLIAICDPAPLKSEG